MIVYTTDISWLAMEHPAIGWGAITNWTIFSSPERALRAAIDDCANYCHIYLITPEVEAANQALKAIGCRKIKVKAIGSIIDDKSAHDRACRKAARRFEDSMCG